MFMEKEVQVTPQYSISYINRRIDSRKKQFRSLYCGIQKSKER